MIKVEPGDRKRVAALVGSILVVVAFAGWRISGFIHPAREGPAPSPVAPAQTVAVLASAPPNPHPVVVQRAAAELSDPFRVVLARGSAQSNTATNLKLPDGALPIGSIPGMDLQGASVVKDGTARPESAPPKVPAEDLMVLMGVISTRNKGVAVFRFGQTQFVVRPGDVVGGYRVSTITDRETVLTRAGTSKTFRVVPLDSHFELR